MGSRKKPQTSRQTYVIAEKAGGTKMPSGDNRDSSVRQGMYGVTMPGRTRQSSNYAVQGSTLMQWDDHEGGSWSPVRSLGPQDIYQAPAPAPAAGPPKPTKPAEPQDDGGGGGGEAEPRQSYATPAESAAITEAEETRKKRAKLLADIEERRKRRLKSPRKYGRFSLISRTEMGVPSLLGG